jgi:uncharacterized protein YacL
VKNISQKVVERGIGAFVSLITALISFLVFTFFSSFATRSDVAQENFKTTRRVDKLESKVDKVLSGLCIIDGRTCKLKE